MKVLSRRHDQSICYTAAPAPDLDLPMPNYGGDAVSINKYVLMPASFYWAGKQLCRLLIGEVPMLKLVVTFGLLGLVSSLILAEAPAERALALSYQTTQLKWGPCPAFIPQGCEIAVLHGDPAKKNSDIFFKVPASFTVPHHWHTSAERMVLVAGELHVTYDGHKTVILKPGMYAYGPAKLPHKAVCSAGAACVLFIAFEAPVDAMPADDTKK